MCRENFYMNGFARRLVMTRYRRMSQSPVVTRVRARCSLVLRSIVLYIEISFLSVFLLSEKTPFSGFLLVLVAHGLAFIQLLHPIICQSPEIRTTVGSSRNWRLRVTAYTEKAKTGSPSEHFKQVISLPNTFITK